jgi:hypothetical protein
MTDSERLKVTSLNLAHAHLTVDALANGVKAAQIPSLTDFVPEIPVDEPAPAPETFEDWVAVLLPLAGRRA